MSNTLSIVEDYEKISNAACSYPNEYVLKSLTLFLEDRTKLAQMYLRSTTEDQAKNAKELFYKNEEYIKKLLGL